MYTKDELPREKLARKGASALTDVELLQAVIGCGGKGNDFRQIARNLNEIILDVGAKNLTIDDVLSIKGMGRAKATVVFAALEFWRRKHSRSDAPLIDTPKKASEAFENIRKKKQEHFAIITLDGARRLINNHIVTIGTLTSSLVHPREVFALAIEDRAASIIIAHNHPSGNLDISGQDKKVTDIIKKAGEIMNIPLDDHLIVTENEFVSVPAE